MLKARRIPLYAQGTTHTAFSNRLSKAGVLRQQV